MRSLALYPFIVFAAFHSYHSLAQEQIPDSTGNYDFLPQTKVIFDDDFSSDKSGTFPKHWRMSPPCGEGRLYFASPYCKVQKAGDTAALVIAPVPKKDLENYIQPDLKKDDYLPDSFSLEYDFALETQDAYAALLFEFNKKCLVQAFNIYNTEEGNFESFIEGWAGSDAHYYKYKKKIPQKGSYDAWHHLALSYNKKAIKCFVDKYEIFNTADCGFIPTRFIFTCNGGSGNAKYANVRLATGSYMSQKDMADLNKLLTEKKLVTHAILFEVNSARMASESINYIQELASFLQKNKEINLEIDGHTDSDGTAQSNLLLSQKRALEVKKQLVLSGITKSRLIAKGFGSSKPLTSNTTEEGKAANRRVEFIVPGS